MDIREYKQKKKNAHKIRFDSALEFITPADTKKNKEKNFHFCIFEDVPVTNSAAMVPKNKKATITSYLKSILDQQELAIFDEERKDFRFHNVQFLTSLFDDTGDRSILDRVLRLEVHETYFE